MNRRLGREATDGKCDTWMKIKVEDRQRKEM